MQVITCNIFDLGDRGQYSESLFSRLKDEVTTFQTARQIKLWNKEKLYCEIMQNTDEFLEKLISYEAKMMQIFKLLQLRPNQWQLLKAFIIASKGAIEFEASFAELDGLMHKKGKGSRKSGYALKSLLRWQTENRIELIRVVQPGQRKIKDDGTFDYLKTQFRFMFLDKLVDVFYSDTANFETVLDELIETLKSEFKDVGRMRKYHPRHNLKKAEKTIETKFIKVFELSKEAGLNPVAQCQLVLDKTQNILGELQSEFIGNENKEKFISHFESLLVYNKAQKEEAVIG